MEAFDLTGEISRIEQQPRFTGSYSYVYRGFLNNIPVAIKIIRAASNTSLQTMRRKVTRERSVWAALNHPNILPFYGFADDDRFEPFGALISPWCQYGDTDEYLNQYGSRLTMDQRISLWKDAIAGVTYLHSYQPMLIHGDIKPGNVLVDAQGRAMLCDFGLVRIFLDEGSSGMTTTTAHTGTERYLAPELVNGDDLVYPSTASDVYALGCLGMEYVFGQKVYAHRKHNLRGCLIEDITKGLAPAQEPDDIDDTTSTPWYLIQLCWNPDHAQRPAAWWLWDQLSPPPATSPSS